MHRSSARTAVALWVVLAAGCGARTPEPTTPSPPAPRSVAPGELRTPADFADITDPVERSRVLFLEAARVFMHPRCVNCHPDGDVPHQGLRLALHEPPVVRGPHDEGVAGMPCSGCHPDANQPLTRVPGAPKWALAPREMAWIGKSAGHICEQIKDPKRNHGKSLAEIVEQSAHDALVAWGWSPGADREPAPGTQAQFGALVSAWVETGAACPPQEASR